MCHNGWKDKDCRNIDFGDLERDNDCFQMIVSQGISCKMDYKNV